MPGKILYLACFVPLLASPVQATPAQAARSINQSTGLLIDLRQAMRMSVERNFDVRLSAATLADEDAALMRARGELDFNLSGTVARSHSESPSSSSLDGVASVVQSDSTAWKPTLSKKTALGTELSLPYSYSATTSNSTYNRFPTDHSASLGLKLTQPLIKPFFGGYFGRSIEKSKLALEAARAKHGEKIDDTALRSAELFLDALRERETIRVRELSLKNASEASEFVLAKREVGKASLIDELDAETGKAKASEALLSARSSATSRSDDFAAHALGELPESVELSAELEDFVVAPIPVSMEQAMADAEKRRPELRSLALEVEKAEVDLRAASADLMPTLNFEGSVTQKGIAASHAAAQEQVNRGSYRSWSAGLKLERPLFQYASRGAYDSKALQLEQKKIKLAQSRRDLELELRKSTRDIEVNWARLEALGRAASAQAQKLEAQVARFEAGKLSVADLNRSRQESESAELEKIKARFAYVKSRLRFASATGRLLEMAGL